MCALLKRGNESSDSTSEASRGKSNSIVVAGRFRLCRRLGGGAFGDVFSAVDVSTGALVAIKFEPVHSNHQPHLYHEARLYAFIGRHMNVGFPKVRWWGREGDYNAMVMDLLGPSLEDLFDYCGRRFDLKTVLMLADQMISRVEFLHALSYIHRDLKPENFAMGLGKRAHHVYLIDLGLAKRFRDLRGTHIPYLDGKSLTGTARYVSINTHLGVQQSRRDDLEGVGQILIYLARGSLPWQGVKCATKAEKYEKIKEMKISTSIGSLCEGLPKAFATLLTYSRSLGFQETPDYGRCRRLFSDALAENGYEMDFQFSWLQKSTAALQSQPVPQYLSPLSKASGREPTDIATGATEGDVSVAGSPAASRRESAGVLTPPVGSPHASPIMSRIASYAGGLQDDSTPGYDYCYGYGGPSE